MDAPLSLYADLGVTRQATTEEISTKYHELVFEFHPDRHVGAGDLDLAAYNEKMSKITYAYEVLSNDETRRQYDHSFGGPRPSEPKDNVRATPKRPNDSQCMFCASTPVVTVTLRRGVGMLFDRRHYSYTIRSCKSCGTEMFRQFQNATLVSGWWGIISFFTNFYYVVANFMAYRVLRTLPEPVRPTGPIYAPRPEPGSPGRPLVARAGVWIAIVALGLAVSYAGVFTHPKHYALNGHSHNFVVGACVANSGNNIYGEVSCTSKHFAKIVAITTSNSLCPVTMDYYFVETIHDPRPGAVVCIDSKL